MSLAAAAQHIASKGRGQDSVLVHMTPGEVQGLQALALKHGGSLTINPETGLVEAGFLRRILPMAVGFALGPAGFGLMSSLGAAATVGGLTALGTGSLGRGLMAGLGAYGGAGIGEAVSGLAGSAGAAGAAGANAAYGAAAEATLPELAKAAVAEKGMFGAFGEGMSQLMKPGGYDALNALTGGKAFSTLAAGAAPLAMGALGSMTGGTTTQMPGVDAQGQPFMPRNYKYDPGAQGGEVDMSSREKPWFRSPNAYTPFAEGGGVDSSERDHGVKQLRDYAVTTPMVGAAGAGTGGGGMQRDLSQAFPFAHLPPENTILRALMKSMLPRGQFQQFNEGGLASAAPQGRFLNGPGDGVSDSIPAQINGREPAKLADGEFVLPARVVSEIGNGSSEAGAKRLYAMMERIQQRRQKSAEPGNVAIDSRAYRALPA